MTLTEFNLKTLRESLELHEQIRGQLRLALDHAGLTDWTFQVVSGLLPMLCSVVPQKKHVIFDAQIMLYHFQLPGQAEAIAPAEYTHDLDTFITFLAYKTVGIIICQELYPDKWEAELDKTRSDHAEGAQLLDLLDPDVNTPEDLAGILKQVNSKQGPAEEYANQYATMQLLVEGVK